MGSQAYPRSRAHDTLQPMGTLGGNIPTFAGNGMKIAGGYVAISANGIFDTVVVTPRPDFLRTSLVRESPLKSLAGIHSSPVGMRQLYSPAGEMFSGNVCGDTMTRVPRLSVPFVRNGA